MKISHVTEYGKNIVLGTIGTVSVVGAIGGAAIACGSIGLALPFFASYCYTPTMWDELQGIGKEIRQMNELAIEKLDIWAALAVGGTVTALTCACVAKRIFYHLFNTSPAREQ